MGKVYETKGTLFVIPTMNDKKGIIALDFKDYEGLLSVDMMNEEVDVVVKKAEWGSEYSDEPPSCKLRGGLYPIEMDASMPKPQVDFSGEYIEALFERGFRDLDQVDVRIEGLPYQSFREPNYDDVKFGID